MVIQGKSCDRKSYGGLGIVGQRTQKNPDSVGVGAESTRRIWAHNL